MKSAEQILRDALIGKTLIKLKYDENRTFYKEIIDLEIHLNEDGDAKIHLYLKGAFETEVVEAYPNEGIEVG